MNYEWRKVTKFDGKYSNSPSVNAVPTEVKIIYVEIDAVARVAVTVFAHYFNAVALAVVFLKFIGVIELAEPFAYERTCIEERV